MKCHLCGVDFLPWEPEDAENEIEAVAALIGTICRPCYIKSFDEFMEAREIAADLRRNGIDNRMVDRIMRFRNR